MVPILATISSVFMVLVPLITQPTLEYLYALVLLRGWVSLFTSCLSGENDNSHLWVSLYGLVKRGIVVKIIRWLKFMCPDLDTPNRVF